MTVEQLDLFIQQEKEALIKSRLSHIHSLLQIGNLTDIKVIAINKHYEWSFLGKKDGSLKVYSIYKRVNGNIELRNHGHLMYPFERVVNGTLNFILIKENERGNS